MKWIDEAAEKHRESIHSAGEVYTASLLCQRVKMRAMAKAEHLSEWATRSAGGLTRQLLSEKKKMSCSSEMIESDESENNCDRETLFQGGHPEYEDPGSSSSRRPDLMNRTVALTGAYTRTKKPRGSTYSTESTRHRENSGWSEYQASFRWNES